MATQAQPSERFGPVLEVVRDRQFDLAERLARDVLSAARREQNDEDQGWALTFLAASIEPQDTADPPERALELVDVLRERVAVWKRLHLAAGGALGAGDATYTRYAPPLVDACFQLGDKARQAVLDECPCCAPAPTQLLTDAADALRLALDMLPTLRELLPAEKLMYMEANALWLLARPVLLLGSAPISSAPDMARASRDAVALLQRGLAVERQRHEVHRNRMGAVPLSANLEREVAECTWPAHAAALRGPDRWKRIRKADMLAAAPHLRRAVELLEGMRRGAAHPHLHANWDHALEDWRDKLELLEAGDVAEFKSYLLFQGQRGVH